MMFADTTLDPYIVTGVVAVLGTAVGALIWVIKFMFNKLVPMIEGLTTSTSANTKATKAADTYLRERNGRDNEVHKEVIKSIKEIVPTMQRIADSSVQAVVDNISRIPEQRVEHQHVEKAVVTEVKK